MNNLNPRYLPATAPVDVARVYPPDIVRQLVDVENWPPADRNARIDKLTLELHRRGLARDPANDSMAGVWASMRTVAGLLR